jgi:hypothetical protein
MHSMISAIKRQFADLVGDASTGALVICGAGLEAAVLHEGVSGDDDLSDPISL